MDIGKLAKSVEDVEFIAKLFQKLSEISAILDPQAYDPQSFKNMLMEMDSSINDQEAEYIGRLYGFDVIEAKFAYELTSLYFLSLRNKQGFRFAGHSNYYSKREEDALKRISTSKSSREDHRQESDVDNYSSIFDAVPISADEKLLTILEKDEEIREWFSKWIQDLRNYHNETSKDINEFFNKISPK